MFDSFIHKLRNGTYITLETTPSRSAQFQPIIEKIADLGLDHLVDGIKKGHASAVLAASIFHFGTYKIMEAKRYMARAGIAVRLDQAPTGLSS